MRQVVGGHFHSLQVWEGGHLRLEACRWGNSELLLRVGLEGMWGSHVVGALNTSEPLCWCSSHLPDGIFFITAL